MTNPKPVLLTADGYTLDRKMRLVPVDATNNSVEAFAETHYDSGMIYLGINAAIAAAPSPDPAVFINIDAFITCNSERGKYYVRFDFQTRESAQRFHAEIIGASPDPAVFADAGIDVDALSNFIRKVDGNNRLGAGALAERIAGYLERKP